MATRWHYQRNQAEFGPVDFPELVRLVRAERLSADDLVREDWNSGWRPAAMAVGLFHMAGRQDLFDRWEAEQAELRRQEMESRTAESGLDVGADEPAWQRRLREIESERLALEAQIRTEREAELAASATRTEIDDALAAALEEIETRERMQQPTRKQRLWRMLTRRETVHTVFRWMPTLVVPNLLAWWILNWSEGEAQRYPSRQTIEAGMRPFPVWGECDSQLYLFLLFDVMVVAATAAYTTARILEQCADD